MRYFATADDQESLGKKKKKLDGSMTEVEEQILGNITGEKKECRTA
jgi:myosin-5